MKNSTETLVESLPFILGDYNFIQVLGSGGFSTVFKVEHISSGHFFAAKSCAIKTHEKAKRNVAIAEMNSLKSLYHQNIIKIYDIVEGHDHIFMILEYMNGGSAKSLIPRKVGMKYSMLISSIKQVLCAVDLCHSLNIAHRDIKPDNILYDESGRCVLSDFGLSCNMGKSNMSNDFSGSLPYKAPEILKHHEYDPFKADMWALGVTFYYMATGDLPWDKAGDTKKMIVNGFYIIPKRVNTAIQYIIRSTLIVDPTKRATAKKLLSMPIFNRCNEIVPIAESQGRASLALRAQKSLAPIAPRRTLTKKSLSMSSIKSFLDISNSKDEAQNQPLPCLRRQETLSIICPDAKFIDDIDDNYSSNYSPKNSSHSPTISRT